MRGRVLAVSDGAIVVHVVQAGGSRTVSIDGAARSAPDLRPGDLVEVDGASVRVVRAHPTGEFPAPGSDAMRLAPRWERLGRRAELVAATRAWFREAGFLEVETPLLVESPGTEVHLAAVAATLRREPGAQAETRYLITSPEYHMKRLLAADSPPIVQICKVWRDGERGGHHRPEFTMIEWYRPWAGYEAIMDDCEAWLCALAGSNELVYQGRRIDLSRPWRRITFREALRERGGVADPDALSPDEQMQVLVDRVEPTLGRERPEFLTEYPIAMASLARPAPHDPTVAERFELFVGGLELGNAFGELTDPAEQRRRCEEDNRVRRESGLPEYPIDEGFLTALEEGLPPSAGIAVGLDRVIMLLTDADRIDDVLAF